MNKISNRLFLISLSFFLNVFISAQVAIIDVNNVKQYIDGFGASTAWSGRLSNTVQDIAFNNTNSTQLGLSILRVRIDPDSLWSDELVNAQRAKLRGVKILATPWTPPAWMKTNKSTTNGGELMPQFYGNYVTYLNNFCNYMVDVKGNKLVDVVSLQNEPDIVVSYESCSWSPTQFQTFVKNYASGIQTPVMMAESFCSNFGMTDPTLNDPVAVANMSFIGVHLYGTTIRNYQNAINKGKRVWMTEHYYNPDDINTCMTMGKEILDCMYNNFNAYIWWYLVNPGCNLISSTGTIHNKGYVMAQFSKFIRPGYYRVDATYQPQSGVYIVAFKGPINNVIVAINLNNASVKQTFTIQNDLTSQGFNKYVTSATENLTNVGALAYSNSSFTDNLEAQSINTYVSSIVSGINETKMSSINIYPNPSSDFIQLSSITNVSEIKISNLVGQIMVSLTSPSSGKINVSNFASGIYLIDVIQNGRQKTIKFLKK